jgi:hypothetical protein
MIVRLVLIKTKRKAMSKHLPIYIEGEKWIPLTYFSEQEKKSFKEWLPSYRLKKVMLPGVELNECLDFKTYACWLRLKELTYSKSPLLDF